MAEAPEPWLRGPLADVHPLIMPVFFSFAQTREDLEKHVAGLNKDEVWQRFGKSSVGFHIKHLAGSVDRLSTYLSGGQLDADQVAFLQNEHEANGDSGELIRLVHTKLALCEARLREIDPNTIFDARAVGRQKLPTTVIGLLVHLAEHTQRHLGQAITLAQLLRQAR